MSGSNNDKTAKSRAAIETAVYHAIFDNPSFTIDMPKITPELWERVSIRTPDNVNENERLEFLGDSLMDASIAIALYKIVPEGTPHKYTVILGVLHANRTFCYLAQKMKIEYGGADTKNIGDVFETIVGAYYTEKGFEAVHEWAMRVYEPLVHAANNAFDECQRKFDICAEEGSPVFGKGKSRARRQSSTAQYRQPTYPSSPVSARERSRTEGAMASSSTLIGETANQTPSHRRKFSTARTQSARAESEQPTRSYPSQYTVLDSDSEDDPLPEFWEKIRLADGKVVFLDHKTETTTWEDPRRARTPSPSPEEVPAAWRARLLAGFEELDDGPRDPYDFPFPDLAGEGYTLGVVSPAGSQLNPSGALPDFWEQRRGLDGKMYYIDHSNAKIIEQHS